MRTVFLRIVGFVILIDLFYMGIGRFYLSQSERIASPKTIDTNKKKTSR